MSRTYKKGVRAFVACSHDKNVNYYKLRRRKRRRMDNHELHNLIIKYDPYEVDERLQQNGRYMPTENQWEEPTDGHYVITKIGMRISDRIHNEYNEWMHKKYDRYLKNKHYKH